MERPGVDRKYDGVGDLSQIWYASINIINALNYSKSVKVRGCKGHVGHTRR